MLLIILLMVFVLSIGLLAAATSVVQQVRREREEEMIHRGAQYARAIKKYMRKFGRYPTRIEELENTSNIRFLRQRYKDPMTPSGEWHLVRYGEVQMGQGGVSGIGGTQGGLLGGGGAFGSNQAGAARTGSSGQGSAFSGPATSSSGSFSGTFGGGPIIGVSSASEARSIREFNGKSHYNQWQFIYDPTVDRGGLITGPYQPLQQLMPGAQVPGQQPNQTPGQPTTGIGIRP